VALGALGDLAGDHRGWNSVAVGQEARMTDPIGSLFIVTLFIVTMWPWVRRRG